MEVKYVKLYQAVLFAGKQATHFGNASPEFHNKPIKMQLIEGTGVVVGTADGKHKVLVPLANICYAEIETESKSKKA